MDRVLPSPNRQLSDRLLAYQLSNENTILIGPADNIQFLDKVLSDDYLVFMNKLLESWYDVSWKGFCNDKNWSGYIQDFTTKKMQEVKP